MKESVRLFKALSDETRLRILALLDQGELCVCDLVTILALPQSTVSRHLATLRNAALVEDRRQGVWMYYRLPEDGPPLRKELAGVLRAHLRELPRARRDLDALRAQKKTPAGCD